MIFSTRPRTFSGRTENLDRHQGIRRIRSFTGDDELLLEECANLYRYVVGTLVVLFINLTNAITPCPNQFL